MQYFVTTDQFHQLGDTHEFTGMLCDAKGHRKRTHEADFFQCEQGSQREDNVDIINITSLVGLLQRVESLDNCLRPVEHRCIGVGFFQHLAWVGEGLLHDVAVGSCMDSLKQRPGVDQVLHLGVGHMRHQQAGDRTRCYRVGQVLPANGLHHQVSNTLIGLQHVHPVLGQVHFELVPYLRHLLLVQRFQLRVLDIDGVQQALFYTQEQALVTGFVSGISGIKN